MEPEGVKILFGSVRPLLNIGMLMLWPSTGH